MAYGSPNSLDEVGDYLAQVRGGRVSTPEEIEHLKQRYQRVGGQTPLLQITKSQTNALEKKLIADGTPARVLFGMKHWHPFVEDVVEKISIDNPTILVGLALAPHYSKLSIDGYEDSVRRGLARKSSNIHFVMVKSWHKEPSLITALSSRVRSALSEMSGSDRTMVVFTAHSLPLRAVPDDDPYQDQLLETSRLVAKEARVTDWDFAFQSASGPSGTWLGPNLIPQRRSKVHRSLGRTCHSDPCQANADSLGLIVLVRREKTVRSESILRRTILGVTKMLSSVIP